MVASPFWRWFECHPGLGTWVQAIGTIAAVLVAIGVPWAIHLQQIRAADAPRRHAEDRLNVVLREIQGFCRYLQQTAADEGDQADQMTKERAKAMAVGHFTAYSAMLEALPVIPPLLEKADLADVEKGKAITAVAGTIEGMKEALRREIGFVRKTPTPSVMTSSIFFGNDVAGSLLDDLDVALAPKVKK